MPTDKVKINIVVSEEFAAALDHEVTQRNAAIEWWQPSQRWSRTSLLIDCAARQLRLAEVAMKVEAEADHLPAREQLVIPGTQPRRKRKKGAK